MVERQEVEALLAYVEMRMASDKVELPPSVSDSTIAALCRAWLAVDEAQVGVVEEYGRNSGKWYLDIRLDELPDGMIHERVRIVKEVEEIPKPGTQRMFSEAWSDPEFVAQVEAEKAETQAAIERHSREADK